MVRRAHRSRDLAGERGQASLLLLGLIAVLVGGMLILFGFGQALGARGARCIGRSSRPKGSDPLGAA